MAARPTQAAAAAPPASGSPEVHHLQTTASVGFTSWWLVLLLLHGVYVGYYGLAGVLYRVMRESSTVFYLESYSIGISRTQYANVSTIHWIIASMHLLFMMAMVVGSLQARRLVFLPRLPPWIRVTIRTRLAVLKQRATEHAGGSFRAGLTRHVSSFSEHSTAVFGRDGVLGVDSVYFDHVLLVREFLETTLQTIQVYRMSYLLPRVWLIRFYVLLLVANCWSLPLVHRYFAHRHASRRMASLLCDAVLDMVSSIGVSFWIFATYVVQYTDPVDGFPASNWSDDVWFTNVQQEFKMMLVVNWADLASRLVFAVGVLQCMESIMEILTPPDGPKPLRLSVDKVAAASFMMPPSIPKDEASGTKKVGPVPSQLGPVKPNQTIRTRAVKFLLETAAPAFFILLGCAILVVQVVSETRESSSRIPCQLQLKPWFVRKPACSLVQLDCHQLGGVSGSQETMQEAWSTYEFGTTARLVVRHCPKLDVPSTLQQFHELTGFKLYNSSVTSWPVEAAFTTASHRQMRAFFAIRTNFANGELPPGLVTTQFPKTLMTIVTSATNLEKFPENLNELWPPGMTLVFERSPLQHVPLAIIQMNAYLVSFSGSPIASVPAELFEAPLLAAVLLGDTRLQELPREVAHPSPALSSLLVEHTNVSTFWAWVEPCVHFWFSAVGSRYCTERDAIIAGNRSRFSIAMAEPSVHDLASVMDTANLESVEVIMACETPIFYYFPLEQQDLAAALSP